MPGTVPIPQGATIGDDKASMPIPSGATVGEQPDSVLGGAWRRLKSMVPDDSGKSASEVALEYSPIGIGAKLVGGQIQAEKQLGPQFMDQSRAAAASHPGQNPALPHMPTLEDARAAVTGLSMLNPFASASVANVNQLEDQGRGREAAGQGLTDAALLAAGEGVSKIPVRAPLRMLGKTMEENAPKVAEFAAHPIATTVRPLVRGGIRMGGKALQGMAGGEAPTLNTAPEAAASPLDRPVMKSAAPAEAPPAPYRLRGKQIQDAVTVTPRKILGPERMLKAAPAESGTYMADPRTGEQILEDQEKYVGGGQGKVAMQGFGTAKEGIEETMTPLKAKTPAGQNAEVMKKAGIAGPKATLMAPDEIPSGALTPDPKATFKGLKSGEAALRQQLTDMKGPSQINKLRAIAVQRGIKVGPTEANDTLINKIVDSATPKEIEAFDQARSERIQPDYRPARMGEPSNLMTQPESMTDSSDLIKGLESMKKPKK